MITIIGRTLFSNLPTNTTTRSLIMLGVGGRGGRRRGDGFTGSVQTAIEMMMRVLLLLFFGMVVVITRNTLLGRKSTF